MRKNSNAPTKQTIVDKNLISISQTLGLEQIELQLPEVGFVDQKSDKETRKKLVKEQIFGIKEQENISKRQKFFKTLLTVLFIVFVLSVLVFTAYSDFFADGREFPSLQEFKNILGASWIYLLLALFSILLYFVFKALKLSFMCKALTKKFHFKTCFETAIIGSYYNTVTPLATGGQSFEIHHLSKHGIDGGVAYTAPIASFFFNQLAFVVLGVTALVLFYSNAFELPISIYGIFPNTVKILSIIGLVCCTLMPVLVVLFSLTPRIGVFVVKKAVHILAKLRLVKTPKETTEKVIKGIVHNADCMRKIGKKPLALISTFLMSFFEYFATISITFFVLKAFGYQTWYNDNGIYNYSPNWLMWLQAGQITLILSASIAFIPTPGNSGAADLSFFLFFEKGLKAGFAFPATVLWRLLSFYSYIIIGFTFATLKKRADNRRLKKAQSEYPIQLEMDLTFEEKDE